MAAPLVCSNLAEQIVLRPYCTDLLFIPWGAPLVNGQDVLSDVEDVGRDSRIVDS